MEVECSPNNRIYKCGLLKHERDDLYTLNTILPSNPENAKIQASKLVKE